MSLRTVGGDSDREALLEADLEGPGTSVPMKNVTEKEGLVAGRASAIFTEGLAKLLVLVRCEGVISPTASKATIHYVLSHYGSLSLSGSL